MRRDLFLHFLNRDTREVFGLYTTLSNDAHAGLLRRALNAAIMLCEDRCVAPPGFVVEDQIAFLLAENQGAFLREGLIQLPMRESSLAEFAEKKRIGYQPMRDRYSGLFSDTRIGFLGDNATGIIRRKTHITEGILRDWSTGAEAGKKIWKPVKNLLKPAGIDLVAKVPLILDQRGTAVTWAAIQPELPSEASAAKVELRNTLQHIYFKQYCDEFRLCALTGIPYIQHDFDIPCDTRAYNFRRLGAFLEIFDLRDILFDAPADLLVALRRRPGFIGFMDAFVALSSTCKTETDLKFFSGQARAAVRFGWDSLNARRLSFYEGSAIEIDELASALEEVAAHLTIVHGLQKRSVGVANIKAARETLQIMSAEPELVFYVALEEELAVLTKSLGLKKMATTPEAIGELEGVHVAVICPRNMGRVAAAVSMSTYLAKRKALPKLILIVGLAGGFEENKSEPGHVIIVTKVVDLAMRKVSDEEDGVVTHFRREDYTLHDQLLKQILSDNLDKDDWSARVCKDLSWPKNRRPSVWQGPLASADEVVASDDWRKNILTGKGGDPKLLGVEMEAGGVCAAARKFNVPISMLRVISDQADPSKADDSWRKLGMETLADLLKSIGIAQVLEAIG